MLSEKARGHICNSLPIGPSRIFQHTVYNKKLHLSQLCNIQILSGLDRSHTISDLFVNKVTLSPDQHKCFCFGSRIATCKLKLTFTNTTPCCFQLIQGQSNMVNSSASVEFRGDELESNLLYLIRF